MFLLSWPRWAAKVAMTTARPALKPDALLKQMMRELRTVSSEVVESVYGIDRNSAIAQLEHGGSFLVRYWPPRDPSRIYVAFQVTATPEQIVLLKEKALRSPLARLLRALIGGSGELTINEELVPSRCNRLDGTLWYARR